MAELQQNRYDQLIRRVGGIIGAGSMVSEAIGELFPMLEVENTTPEILALSGWRTAWQSTERPAAAGANAASMLFNPGGSGVLVAVTQVRLRVNIGTAINVELQDVQFGAAPVRGLFRDSRFGGERETTAVVGAADGVVVGGGLFLRTNANLNLAIEDDNGVAVLAPGTGLAISTIDVNARLTVNYFWRERPAEPSELSF